MKSMEHGYAQIAYDCIKKVERSGYAKEYGRLCHKFPSMVLMNGLMLTVSFFQAQDRDGDMKAYGKFISDLGLALGIGDWTEMPKASTEYRQLSRQALRAAVWFKRYAEAILKVRVENE